MLEYFFILSLIVQCIHGSEALIMGAHREWYLFTMPFWVLLLWEIVFLGFWSTVYVVPGFPWREHLEALFLVLMFANGLQHIVWWGTRKSYVPGIFTAPLHVVVFLAFYFSVLF